MSIKHLVLAIINCHTPPPPVWELTRVRRGERPARNAKVIGLIIDWWWVTPSSNEQFLSYNNLWRIGRVAVRPDEKLSQLQDGDRIHLLLGTGPGPDWRQWMYFDKLLLHIIGSRLKVLPTLFLNSLDFWLCQHFKAGKPQRPNFTEIRFAKLGEGRKNWQTGLAEPSCDNMLLKIFTKNRIILHFGKSVTQGLFPDKARV